MDDHRTENRASNHEAHPLSDLAEAESIVRDADTANGDPARRPETGHPSAAPVATIESLKEVAETWSAVQSFQTLHGLANSLTADLDLRSLVHEVLASAVRVFRADRGVLCLGRGDENGLVPVTAFNIKGEEIESLECLSKTILRLGQQGELLITQDAIEDPRLRDVPSVQTNRMRSVLCAPIVYRTERTGAIYLDATRPNAFPPDSERILRAFCDLAATTMENARVHGELVFENARLRRRESERDAFSRLVGSSPSMELVRRRAQVAAQVEGPILIQGERGSGRELLARAIHEASYRSFYPFVAVDCTAIPTEDIVGLLFGRTGAPAARTGGERSGILPSADRGTIFLSEVERLDEESGERLLNVIREYAFKPIGARNPTRVDVRLVLATSKDLRDEADFGYFSKELFQRARALSLRVPPLRERMADVPELVDHFLSLHADNRGRSGQVTYTVDALHTLHTHYWPGNVEELERVVRRTTMMSGKKIVSDVDVKRALLPTPEDQALLYGPWTGRVVPIALWEREAIRQALVQTKGNRSEASKLLGVHRNTLVRKIKEYGLE